MRLITLAFALDGRGALLVERFFERGRGKSPSESFSYACAVMTRRSKKCCDEILEKYAQPSAFLILTAFDGWLGAL